MFIAPCSVHISTQNHSMHIKQMMRFVHRTKNVLEMAQPHKCLFASLCIKVRVVFLQSKWTKPLLTFTGHMILQVEHIDYLLNILPYLIMGGREGKSSLRSFQSCQVTHVIVSQSNSCRWSRTLLQGNQPLQYNQKHL